jgi:hypothetical protein
MVFMQPQRLVVPLFQRPYVRNEENQWDPVSNDVVRVADRVLTGPGDKHHANRGLWFFLTDQISKTSLRRVRRD